VQRHGTAAFNGAKRLLSLTSPGRPYGRRSDPAVTTKQILRVFKQGLVTHPTEAGELIFECYQLTPAVAAKVIAELVADSVAMVQAVTELALTERGIPVQLLNQMVQMQLGEVQPLLMALVQGYPTQVYESWWLISNPSRTSLNGCLCLATQRIRMAHGRAPLSSCNRQVSSAPTSTRNASPATSICCNDTTAITKSGTRPPARSAVVAARHHPSTERRSATSGVRPARAAES
jgi:hypothetical protein